ncbi:MAG: amidohydrolase family protein [Rhodospirillaceae bacterium]|nr:amidohydrolase family protein [Rhodospirillaceae bacterium]
MADTGQTILLKGAHVVDPAQGIDRVADILVAEGKIAAVGEAAAAQAPAGIAALDLAGCHLSPGWFDIHIHAYGMLGFADPDSIGIRQGVTTYIDAGGPGIGVMEEFAALLEGHTVTDLYAGPYIRPMGIIGAQYVEGNIRSLTSFPVAEWIDFMAAHPGLVRYLKVAALGSYGTGPLRMAKGLAEIIGVPLYGHIGEYQQQQVQPCVYEIFNISGRGDIITHLYHANDGSVLDENGKVLPVVRDAARRGVLFDIGFGAFNFGWDLAEKCIAQDLRPDIISSDLQQFNVIGPCYSLAHVMGMCMQLGMSLSEAIAAVTAAPAKALALTETVGALRPGMPADITVFKVEEGAFEAMDTYATARTMSRRLVPQMAFKKGVRYDSDMTLCQNEKNWMLQFAEDHVPAAAADLSPRQRDFLGALRAALAPHDWSYALDSLDLDKATLLQGVFRAAAKRQGIPLREALLALFASFLDSPFTMQSGLFILMLNKTLVMDRLEAIAGGRKAAA